MERLAGLAITFVAIAVALVIGVYVIASMQGAVEVVESTYSFVNATSLALGTTTTVAEHTLVLDGLPSTYKLLQTGKLYVTYTVTSTPSACNVSVNGVQVGSLSGTGSDVFDVPLSVLLKQSPVVIEYAGYNVTISESKVEVYGNPQYVEASHNTVNLIAQTYTPMQLIGLTLLIAAAVAILSVLFSIRASHGVAIE